MRYAFNSAQKHGAKLIILHVIDKLPPTARALVFTYLNAEEYANISKEKIVHAKNCIRERLKTVCDSEFNSCPETERIIDSIEVVEGYPTDEILVKANELNCDVIFMGTNGKGFLRHTLFGSTSKKVLRSAQKPVFIVPLPSVDTDFSIHDE
jgi:nucleotide-binding universal stress UspA family protein